MQTTTGAESGQLERELWRAADLLRGSMAPSEYKHVVLGLLFLKYVSDAFEEKRTKLLAEVDQGSDPEDPDEYKAENIFFVPAQARWEAIRSRAKQPTIGKEIDDAMDVIERENIKLKGVLPKIYASPDLDKQRLGQLIDHLSNIGYGKSGTERRDLLGEVYEYFLGQFADSEGKRGGEFYTPGHIVRLLVEMLEPFKGRIYDPCCGSGGMFVASEKFVEQHQGRIDDLSIYGQEFQATTLRLAKMNLAIRGIDFKLEWGDTLLNDLHKELKADYVLANPPFNISEWNGHLLKNDQRWMFGVPPEGNANFAWLQHIVHHLSPSGTAGVVLANGSMTSQSGGEGLIRQNMILGLAQGATEGSYQQRMYDGGVVDCMVALPTQLFYNTQIPVCLWILARDRRNHKHRDRRNEILFIDARKLGRMVNRRHRVLDPADIERIAGVYHTWRAPNKTGYDDQPGFCRSASIDEVAANSFVLTPGRYVGTEEVEADEASYHDTMTRLSAELRQQMAESRRLESVILENLKSLGYGD